MKSKCKIRALINWKLDSYCSPVVFSHVRNVPPLPVIKNIRSIQSIRIKIRWEDFGSPNNLIVFVGLFWHHTQPDDIWALLFLSQGSQTWRQNSKGIQIVSHYKKIKLCSLQSLSNIHRYYLKTISVLQILQVLSSKTFPINIPESSLQWIDSHLYSLLGVPVWVLSVWMCCRVQLEARGAFMGWEPTTTLLFLYSYLKVSNLQRYH